MRRALCVLLPALGIVLFLTSVGLTTAEEPQGDPLAPLHPLLGKWKGAEIGRENSSRVTQVCDFVYGGKFIRSETYAEFDPTEAGAETEVHEDVGYLSFDPVRQLIVFRQFHSEGFVNTYILERATEDSLIFVSESTEGSGGMRARLRYWLSGDDEYVQELDLAPPEASYFTYKRMRMVRSLD